MTVKNIMLAVPKAVRPNDTVPLAVQLMLDHGIRNLPVTDSEGRFLGTFSSVHLIELLLPRAATMKRSHFGGVDDLTFIHETFDDIKDRLEDVRSHPVGDYMDQENVPVISPETSVIEAMLLLYQHRTHVPVVEPDSGKLVGVVTFNCILKAITGAQ